MDYLDYLFDWAGIGESTSPQVWHSAIQSDLRRHSQNPFSSSNWSFHVFSSSRPIHILESVLSTSPGWGCPPGGAPVGKEGSGIAAVSPCCKRWILISMNFRIVNWTRDLGMKVILRMAAQAPNWRSSLGILDTSIETSISKFNIEMWPKKKLECQ